MIVRPTSEGLDPAALEPGRDLVLDMPAHHGDVVADGVYVVDHLSLEQRAAVDAEAIAAFAAWRETYDEVLTVDGLSLADVWESELVAEVFLPTLQAVRGLEAAGADPDPGPAPRYPTPDAEPPIWRLRKPTWQVRVRGTLDVTGVPTRSRGGPLIGIYGPGLAIMERLAADRRSFPLLVQSPPPPPLALRVAARGGVIGLPGLRRRRAAASAAARALREAQSVAPPASLGALGPVLTERALRALGASARFTTAAVPALDRAMAGGEIGAVLQPFDAEVAPKLLVRLAERHGVPTITIQHGYEPHPEPYRPGTYAQHVLAWSEWHRQSFPAERRAAITVTGNPGAGTPAPLSGRAPRRDRPRVVVLIEHKPRHTCVVDRRVGARHLRTALDGLVRTGLDLEVLVRPHPADLPSHYADIAARSGMFTRVASEGPLRALLADADLCVSAVSTGALETALPGTPLIHLDALPYPIVPPLDGTSGVLRARTAEELADLVPQALEAEQPPGREALLEALGHGRDPAGRVIDAVDRISGSGGRSRGRS